MLRFSFRRGFPCHATTLMRPQQHVRLLQCFIVMPNTKRYSTVVSPTKKSRSKASRAKKHRRSRILVGPYFSLCRGAYKKLVQRLSCILGVLFNVLHSRFSYSFNRTTWNPHLLSIFLVVVQYYRKQPPHRRVNMPPVPRRG